MRTERASSTDVHPTPKIPGGRDTPGADSTCIDNRHSSAVFNVRSNTPNPPGSSTSVTECTMLPLLVDTGSPAEPSEPRKPNPPPPGQYKPDPSTTNTTSIT